MEENGDPKYVTVPEWARIHNMHVCVCVCVRACVCVCIYTYIYTHILKKYSRTVSKLVD
jgi:hypothetical protein